ncbi:MAG TPA: cyanophycinase [Actinomycetota bacterium]|nr:cyanophycinase [Actinomycetota bacterium]
MTDHAQEPGPVMIVGGAEDKLGDRVILSRFVELAGGEGARIVVITTASSLGESAADVYREVFLGLGAGEVVGLRPVTRSEANASAVTKPLETADGIFLTGGNQLRLSSIVAGTKLARALRQAHLRGAAIGGTSAGASALAGHMMAFGASGATPKHRMAHVAEGLGILQGMIVDQHFEQRTRLGRLLSVVAGSPSLLGIGLDEDTAAIVHSNDTIEVIGRGAVTIVDGSEIATDAHESRGHRPLMVSGAILHSVPSGYLFDLATRRVRPHLTEAALARRRAAEERARKAVTRFRNRLAEDAKSGTGRQRRARPRSSDREASE